MGYRSNIKEVISRRYLATDFVPLTLDNLGLKIFVFMM